MRAIMGERPHNGVRVAAEIVMAMREAAPEAQQLDLLGFAGEGEDEIEAPLGLPNVDAAHQARRQSTVAKGRRRGAHNRTTTEWINYLSHRYPSPLELLLKMGSASVEALRQDLHCTAEDAFTHKRHCLEAALPYCHQRLAQVEIKPPGSLSGMPVDLEYAYSDGASEEEAKAVTAAVTEIIDEVRDGVGDAGVEEIVDEQRLAQVEIKPPGSLGGTPVDLDLVYSDGASEEKAKPVTAAVTEIIGEVWDGVGDAGLEERASVELPFADEVVVGSKVDLEAEAPKEEPPTPAKPELTVETLFAAFEEVARRDPAKAAELRRRMPELVERLQVKNLHGPFGSG
jgi:hypothetical protein